MGITIKKIRQMTDISALMELADHFNNSFFGPKWSDIRNAARSRLQELNDPQLIPWVIKRIQKDYFGGSENGSFWEWIILKQQEEINDPQLIPLIIERIERFFKSGEKFLTWEWDTLKKIGVKIGEPSVDSIITFFSHINSDSFYFKNNDRYNVEIQRMKVMDILIRIKTPKIIPFLTNCVSDANYYPKVAKKAMIELGKTQSPEVLPFLFSEIQEKNSIELIEAFYQYGENVIPFLIQNLQHKSPIKRCGVSEILGELHKRGLNIPINKQKILEVVNAQAYQESRHIDSHADCDLNDCGHDDSPRTHNQEIIWYGKKNDIPW